VTHIAGRCLPSCLAEVVKQRYGSRPCNCGLNQCGLRREREEALQKPQGDTNAPAVEQDSTADDSSALLTEIDKTELCLTNATDIRSLIQARSLQRRARYIKAVQEKADALEKALAEHEGTRSELAIVQAELTAVKTQLGDKDTELEEAKKLNESLENHVHKVAYSHQLQRENNQLRTTQDEFTSIIAQLRLNEARLTEEVNQLRHCGAYLREEVVGSKNRVIELEEEFDQKKRSSRSADEKTKQFDDTKARPDD
jgi:predicted  nucleic acid-binding Zn-ribbon protein